MIKAEQQAFDLVHDTQRIFRRLLDCAARPGKIQSIHDSIKKLDPAAGISPSLVGIAYTLIDREVTFCVIGEQKQRAEQSLQWKTFSKSAPLAKADYIFIEAEMEAEMDEQEIREVMLQVKRGTLIDPHESATLVFLVQNLSSYSDAGIQLRLNGPGIQESVSCAIEGLSWEWFELRQACNQEFPLGVDIIFVTVMGDVLFLPRTTTVEREGV